MDLADFVDDILALKRNETKAWKKRYKTLLNVNNAFTFYLEYKTFK